MKDALYGLYSYWMVVQIFFIAYEEYRIAIYSWLIATAIHLLIGLVCIATMVCKELYSMHRAITENKLMLYTEVLSLQPSK